MGELLSPVVLTGATGFVGRHVLDELLDAGYEVWCTSRRASLMQPRHDRQRWVELDVERPDTLQSAMEGAQSVIYLIHGMTEAGDYEQVERESAERFAQSAANAGVRRLVYLGGIAPSGKASKHLRSRLAVGETLRNGPVPTVELRAGMIVGAGSESWQIVRDLSLRLPVMVLPRWLKSRSQPIAIADVVVALRHALELTDEKVACYDLPGPEILSGKDILFRVAELQGIRPLTVSVPILTPRLSSYWLKLVTRANFRIAQQLIEGLTSDLVSEDEDFWQLAPEHELLDFDEAARRALRAGEKRMPLRTRLFESAVRRISLRPRVTRG